MMILSEIPSITTDQMREVDRLMTDKFGISLGQMMENAGRNLADLAMEMLYRRPPKGERYHVVVACGKGNNGGGGMVASRFLSNRDVDVSAVLASAESSLRPVPAQRWDTVRKLPVRTIVANSSDNLGIFEEADLIIDAILGYGLEGIPRDIPAHVIREILHSLNRNVLSLDVPSGLDATTGKPPGACISAKATMTLAMAKTGLLTKRAKKYVGKLYVADIGVPPELYADIGLASVRLFADETVVEIQVGS
ncbi:MAG: NAD(P)H-hydrate epimerase [Fidelibacterota bacterium]